MCLGWQTYSEPYGGCSVIMSSLYCEDKGQLGFLDTSVVPNKYPCMISYNDI